MAAKRIFKVIFYNQGKVYEIYARSVSQGGLMGFVEVEQLTFGERSTVLIDPAEERLQSEFTGVKRTYIPMHAVVRIDEVEKEGVAKISDAGSNVTPFPASLIGPGSDSSRD